MQRTRILFASITQGRDQCSISHAISIIKFQTGILSAPIELEYRFEPSLADALDAFGASNADVLVAIDNYIGFPEAFVTENVIGASKEFVAGCFPLPGVIDWERVRAKAHDESEPNAFKHVQYSLDPTAEIHDLDWAQGSQARLDCVILRRSALDRIKESNPASVHPGGLLAHVESIGPDGTKRSKDETLCAMYGKPIWIDLAHPCCSFGSYAFCGAVGLRRVLR